MSEPQKGRVIYLKRDETGGPKWLLFQPLIRPRWVAAALIGAKLVINAISRPKWNKSAKLNIQIKIVCNTQLPLLTNYGKSKHQTGLIAVIPVESFIFKNPDKRNKSKASSPELVNPSLLFLTVSFLYLLNTAR